MFSTLQRKALISVSIAKDVWDRGGVIGAVCHGPVLLPGIIDKVTERSIIEGKTSPDSQQKERWF